MIIWFNCKITDQRLNPQSIVRYNLRNDNRFDVARYSFASYAPLEPLVTKFIFNLELADEHVGREQEMEDWLYKIFPKEKLSIHWFRANNIAQWKEVQEEINAIGDNLIFPQGNEDHIFMDSNIEIFKKGLELIQQDSNPFSTFMTSHYPENIRASQYPPFKPEYSDCGNFISYELVNNDAIRVMKKEYFDWYINQVSDPNAFIFRSEHWNNINIVNNRLYAPTKEQFRHYDGYAHVGIGPDTCPPLDIPAGFFNGMTIRYGFDDYQEGAVNVNPTKNLRTADETSGVDYKLVLDELPAFWKNHTKQIISADNLDERELNKAYDLHLLEKTRTRVNWHHVGALFDDSNWPNAKCINNHTKEYLFYE